MRETPATILWTGNAGDARAGRKLIANEIYSVVDLAYEEPPAALPREIVYCRFPLHDGGDNDPELLRLAVNAVAELLASGRRTLVACSAGISRSPTIAAFAISDRSATDADELLASMAEQRQVQVNPAFVASVRAALRD